jgi:hypothetical protein
VLIDSPRPGYQTGARPPFYPRSRCSWQEGVQVLHTLHPSTPRLWA